VIAVVTGAVVVGGVRYPVQVQVDVQDQRAIDVGTEQQKK
jgi:hypothetical protein